MNLTMIDRETFERSIRDHQIGDEGLVRPDPDILPSSPVHSSEKTLDSTVDKIIRCSSTSPTNVSHCYKNCLEYFLSLHTVEIHIY